MISFAGYTLQSPEKDKNGDSFGIYELQDEIVLFLMADGVGGSAGDWKASSTCVNEFKEIFLQSNIKSFIHRIKETINVVNRIVLNETGLYQGMKSTFVVAVLDKKTAELYYTGIGDSRIYKITSKNVELLTNDQVKAVMIRKPDGSLYTQNGSVVSAFGVTNLMGINDLHFDVKKITLKETSAFLLASDGFYRKLNKDNSELFELYNSLNPDNSLKKLSNKVEQNQDDDATAIFFRVEVDSNSTGSIEKHRQISNDLLKSIKEKNVAQTHQAIDYLMENNVIQTFDYYDKAIKLMRKMKFEDGKIYLRLIDLLKKSRN